MTVRFKKQLLREVVMRTRIIRLFILVGLIFPALASHSMAATINVTSYATDTLNGADSQCSLREAITNINNGATTYADCIPSGSYGTGDTINIPAGTYTTAIAGTGDDLNASGDYDINKSVSIVGTGASSTTINGGGLDRVFHIGPDFTRIVAASISGVTITGGYTSSNWPDGDGGGILNSASPKTSGLQ
jgi:CSLREA domain-containing protein